MQRLTHFAYFYDCLSSRPLNQLRDHGTVPRRYPTAKARDHTRVSPSGICGGQSGTWTGFSPSSSDFPGQYHSARVHTHMSSGEKQQVRWWPQFGDIVSHHGHK
jgi:hypothetical protein